MKIRDLEQQQLQQQLEELEKAQMEKQKEGHEGIYDFEQGHHESYDPEWDVQNPGAEDLDYDDRDYY